MTVQQRLQARWNKKAPNSPRVIEKRRVEGLPGTTRRVFWVSVMKYPGGSESYYVLGSNERTARAAIDNLAPHSAGSIRWQKRQSRL